MKASDYIIKYLAQNQTDKIFGYIGGMITHIVDSIATNPSVEMVNTVNEQGAGFAAEGYARYTNKTGVAIAISGPGATNFLTAVGNCYFDSIPVLFITGQVNTFEYKYDLPVRQIGFQENNISQMAKPVTKYSTMVSDVKNLRYELEKSLYLTQHGRKGPVLLDIPMDIQRMDLDFETQKSFFTSEEHINLESSLKREFDIREIVESIKNAKRPVILAGGGIQISGAQEVLRKFALRTGIPVITSLLGLDSVGGYENNMGFIGAYGNRYGNFALTRADLVLSVGTRLDSRQTGASADTFLKRAKLIRVDIDENEMNCSKIKSDISVVADAKDFLNKLNEEKFDIDIEAWNQRLKAYAKNYPSVYDMEKQIKEPNLFIEKLSDYLREDDVICVDVGQHQMWAAQSLKLKKGQRVFFSGGMGSMGFSLPAAIGAAVASNKRAVVITGDGGLQMNIQELEILKRRNLPVKVIVMNNFSLGMVRQFQEIYFENRCLSTVEDYSAPDFASVAQAYGIKGVCSSIKGNWEECLKTFMEDDSAGIFDVHLDSKTIVEPKLIYKTSLEDTIPDLNEASLS